MVVIHVIVRHANEASVLIFRIAEHASIGRGQSLTFLALSFIPVSTLFTNRAFWKRSQKCLATKRISFFHYVSRSKATFFCFRKSLLIFTFRTVVSIFIDLAKINRSFNSQTLVVFQIKSFLTFSALEREEHFWLMFNTIRNFN